MYRCYSGDVLLVAASAIGRGHIRKNIVCQDKVNFFRKYNVSVLALADGAGSEPNSHFGAEVAVKAISDYLAANFNVLFDDTEGIEACWCISDYVKKQLNKLAVEKDFPIKSLASTLMAVAVCDGRYIVFHVGDGVIGTFVHGETQVASSPENGEFANSTVFMTSEGVEHHVKLFKGNLNDINGFVMMSDGAAHSLFSVPFNKFAGIVDSIFKIAPALPSKNLALFLSNVLKEKVRAKTLDDCSIGLIVMPQKYSTAFKKRCSSIMANLENGLSVYKSLQKAGVHKKYHRRYVSWLTALGWIG